MSAVAGYEYRINGGTAVDVGNVLTTIVSALSPDTSYDFEVRSYDAAGNRSAWSSIVAGVTDPAPPAVPALLAHTKAGSADGGNTATTTGINTTGASLIVVATRGGSSAVTDSEGNTWTALTAYTGARMFYCVAPVTSATHTFTTTGAGQFSAICVQAWSNTDTTSPFDVQNGGNNTSTTIQPGSVTPSVNGEIVITMTGQGSGETIAPTIGSGFTVSDAQPFINSNSFPMAMGYKLQTTAGAENPTWTWNASNANGAAIATFKAGAGVPPIGADGLRIDAGRTVSEGNWQNQTGYVTGGTATNAGTTGLELNAIMKPGRAQNTHIYGSYQSGTSACQYTFSGLTPSTNCLVRVHCHDIGAGAGVYQHSIKANGVTKVSAYDVRTYAGAANTIGIKEFTAAADGSGVLVIEMAPVSTFSFIVHGIEVRQPVPSPKYIKLVTAGDSITRGGGPVGSTQNWPSVLATLLTGGGSAYDPIINTYDVAYDETNIWLIEDIARSGETWIDQTGHSTTHVAPNDDPLWEKQIVFGMAGHNDPYILGTGLSGMITNATNFFAGIPAGWIMGIGTILPQSPAETLYYDDYNDWVRTTAMGALGLDFIVDWDSIMSFDPSDTANLYDGIHPTVARHAIMAGLMQPIIEAL